MDSKTNRFKLIIYVISGICFLTIFLPEFLFKFSEVDIAIDWAMRYFALPILLAMVPISCFIYLKFIFSHEKKKYESKFLIGLRAIARVSIIAFGITAMFVGATISLIILTNAFWGSSKQINVNATVVDYYATTNKGRRTKYYVRIQEPQLNRAVNFQVDSSYAIGQKFVKTVYIGKWGLLYSK